MNSSVNVSANAATNQPQPSQPGTVSARMICARQDGTAKQKMKNVPITNSEMNIVSLVANSSAIRMPISAGWYLRGWSMPRQITTTSASESDAK